MYSSVWYLWELATVLFTLAVARLRFFSVLAYWCCKLLVI